MQTNHLHPALIIDLKKIEENTRLLTNACKPHGIAVAAVTKVFCGIPQVAQAMIAGGADMLADSRISNLKKLKDLGVPRMLLRLPMPGRAHEVVEHADISLNSELTTLAALSAAAEALGTVHKVIIMTDLGDLREGVWHEELIPFMRLAVQYPGIHIIGIGTNLTCYGGVIPDETNLGRLIHLAHEIEHQFGIHCEIISGGNSSSLHLVFQNRIPKGINNIRLGESIVLGLETAYGERIPGTHRDCFTLALEVIELKNKPSAPVGNIGMDAFGQKPVFTDKGIRLRGILAAGRQDLNLGGIIPRDPALTIIGGSSDHLIIDFTESANTYQVGSIVHFDLTYGGLLAAATSPYITKYLV